MAPSGYACWHCAGPDRPALVEQIITAFLKPAMHGVAGADPAAYARLRASLVVERDEFTSALFAKYFDHSTSCFIDALAAALPELPARDLR
jgi:hypothetical protein